MQNKNYQQEHENKTLAELQTDTNQIFENMKELGNRMLGRIEKIETELMPMGIGRTMYPLDYDRNNKHTDKAFNNWADHIRTEQDADFAKSLLS